MTIFAYNPYETAQNHKITSVFKLVLLCRGDDNRCNTDIATFGSFRVPNCHFGPKMGSQSV